MSGSALQRYLELGSAESNTSDAVDAFDDLGAFGFLRGAQDRALMLELRRKDGSAIAFNYAWLDRAELDPSAGIVLSFSGRTVKISGRNLNADARPHVRLFSGIVRHRVPWIQEASESAAFSAGKQVVVVERIQVI